MKTLNYIKLNESGVANVVSALHQLLADFQVYYTNLRGFHWNIKGHGFFVLHEKFEVCMTTQREGGRNCRAYPDVGWCTRKQVQRIPEVAKIKEVSDVACGSDAVSNILETYGYLIGEERKIIELANEAGDDVTADLMTGYLKEQERWFGCWSLSVQKDAQTNNI